MEVTKTTRQKLKDMGCTFRFVHHGATMMKVVRGEPPEPDPNKPESVDIEIIDEATGRVFLVVKGIEQNPVIASEERILELAYDRAVRAEKPKTKAQEEEAQLPINEQIALAEARLAALRTKQVSPPTTSAAIATPIPGRPTKRQAVPVTPLGE